MPEPADVQVDAVARELHRQLASEPVAFDELAPVDHTAWMTIASAVLRAGGAVPCAAADPEWCRRCGSACAHTEPCVLVVDADDGPVCIDGRACSVRREAKGLTVHDQVDPMWWCRECGNRYNAAVGDLAVLCTCGQALQPITVQLVARQA